jgi:oligopeptide transport system ATP-binding protein
MALLDVKNLRVRFETHHGVVNAVDGVSFYLEEGETLGLVGESGSGKSVTNLALMGLIPSPPGIVTAESVRFGNKDLLKLPDEELRKIRGNEIAMIFQDPMTSLNPLLTIDRQLTEVLQLHKGLSRSEARKLCIEGLGDVGIPNPEGRMAAYPHELSGGMRQRVMIAMGLLCKPKLLIADEPTTALDVTIQAQILELMKDLQEKHGTAIILVTHDLGVVAGMTDRINVMYAGRLSETGPCEDLFARPLHPYTRGLLASIPTLEGNPDDPLYSIPGTPPDLADLPKGCSFAPRCDKKTAACEEDAPALKVFQDEVTGMQRRVACFEVSTKGFDPNRALFEQLERQEQEGHKSTSLVWTAKDSKKAVPAIDEAESEDVPSIFMPDNHGDDDPVAEVASEPDPVAGPELAEDSDAPLFPPMDERSELAPEPESSDKQDTDSEAPLFPPMDEALEFKPELEEEPAGGPLAMDSPDLGETDDDSDWKWIGQDPENDEEDKNKA